jgi:hypothetical protein
MRARFAYISSLGTTAILVAAALLMRAVVSAIVAYRGWPGAATGAGVQAVPLATGDTAKRVALVRPHASVARGVERRAVKSRAGARRSLSTAGLVKAKASGPRTTPGVMMVPVSGSPAGQTGVPADAAQPAQPATDAAPSGTVPDPQQGPGAFPGTGSALPLSLPGASSPSPTADPVTGVLEALLGGDAPPPPRRSK